MNSYNFFFIFLFYFFLEIFEGFFFIKMLKVVSVQTSLVSTIFSYFLIGYEILFVNCSHQALLGGMEWSEGLIGGHDKEGGMQGIHSDWTLHYTTLHYTTLHYTTLHYTTQWFLQ